MNRLRRIYGAGPLHLTSMLATLAFAGYLVWSVLPAPNSVRILVWVVAGAVVHDLVLWPAYAVADRVLALTRRKHRRTPAVPWINHVRVPVVLSAVMLLISFPLVLRHSEAAYHTASGLTENAYLGRWLALSGATLVASALIYAGRWAMTRAKR